MNKPIRWVIFFSLTGWLFSLSMPVSATSRQTIVHQNQWVQRTMTGILKKVNNGYQLTIPGRNSHVLYFSDQQVRRGDVIFMQPLKLNASAAIRVQAVIKTYANRPPQVVAIELAPTKSHASFSFYDPGAVINAWCYKIADFIDGIVPSRPVCRSC